MRERSLEVRHHGVQPVENRPHHRQRRAELLLVADFLHRVDHKQSAARHEHALDEPRARKHNPQHPLAHELLLLAHEVAHADGDHHHAEDLEQHLEGQQRVEPDAEQHERRHHADDLAELAPLDRLEVEHRQQTASEKSHDVEHGDRRAEAHQVRAHGHGEDVACETRDRLQGVGQEEGSCEQRFFHLW